MPVSVEPLIKLTTSEFAGWDAVPALPMPGTDEVHLWYSTRIPCLPKPRTTGGPAELEAYLGAEEKTRADRLRFQEHRQQFVKSHAMLRTLIAGYSGMKPSEVSFIYGSHGKPGLSGNMPLTFNLSHAGEVVVCAFARDRQIGVDVERVRANFNVEEIGERFFSAAERDTLRRLPAGEKHDGFFRFWTRKEAYIKARGEGLSHPLHQFDVCLGGSGNLLIHTRPDADEASRWVIWDVAVPSGCVAAVAFEAAVPTDSCAAEPGRRLGPS